MRVNILLSVVGLARAAINLDGSPAVAPAGPGDPSPLGDINEYIPDRHDCPLPCADLTEINTWVRYHSLQRLERCGEPMLMQFSVYHPLDDPRSDVVIHTCTTNRDGGVTPSTPKPASQHSKRNTQLHTSPLDMAQACKSGGSPTDANIQVFTTGSGTGGGQAPDHEAIGLLQGVKAFFGAAENCNENYLFARLNHTLAGVYLGKGLGKKTVESVLPPLVEHLRSGGLGLNHTIAQVCGKDGDPEAGFGIAFNVVGNLVAVQKTLADWGKGICATAEPGGAVQHLQGAKLFTIGEAPPLAIKNNGTLLSRLFRRATCRWIEVESGNGCDALATRCGISSTDFRKYNPKSDLCSPTGLFPGDFVCCSAGDRYVPPKPSANADGSCKSHDVASGDTCASIAKTYGITVDDIESWNKGKTWAWTECRGMQFGYNLCVSPGTPPLPRPQTGAECGPMKPGTTLPPASSGQGLADLNPCPLKTCCSNWGYCGIFSSHCEVHAPPNAGPGAKLEGFQGTCVSNCEVALKSNSGPPANFSRIGYYEAFNFERDCLWLKAKDANTDGTYTHIHWAFGDIDRTSWKVVINDSHHQWADFKKLPLKRIVSLGGWAASTEAPGAYTMRSAIIDNRETFAANLAQFVKDEGIDGIDIDWEYPGAPDIYVDGQVLGQQTDGANYLSFLSSLRRKLPSGASLSIAAPASYWYLKAFPIDKISAVVDYIVYMTYDLHGQWDYGKPNSFDSCPSGKCIRSHVNLTETRNMLAMVLKAGVPGNKVFVGEASYGRTFHMAKDGCWEEMCDFTGTLTESDAAPGRCTKTGGYLGYAEVLEIVARGDGAKVFHDGRSNTDVMLYKGDYIGYMTPTSKDTRRADWKALNFAGSVDWAVDLQSFSNDDMNKYPSGDKQIEGEGCIAGEDDSVNTANLCAFTCPLGYCPVSYCSCTDFGELEPYPAVRSSGEYVVAEDTTSLDLGRMCKFACRFGYCPEGVCLVLPPEPVQDKNPDEMTQRELRDWLNSIGVCQVFKDGRRRDQTVAQCLIKCKPQLDAAKAEGRTSNYGCVAFQKGTGPFVWTHDTNMGDYAMGNCVCDNWLVNEFADTIISALPAIAQIGCYIVMSTLKTIVTAGLQFIPGVGKALEGALDMAMTTVDIINSIYPLGEDPAGAFDAWLSPCGGTDLVPDEIKKVFDILSQATDLGGGRGSRTPKNTKDKFGGKGKKGDEGNPRGTKRPAPAGGQTGNSNKKTKKCNVPARDAVKKVRDHTRRAASCSGDVEHRQETVITSIVWPAKPGKLQIARTCSLRHKHACYHYSSALRNNQAWSTLTCPEVAAVSKKVRLNGPAVRAWDAQHKPGGWKAYAIANQLPNPPGTPKNTCQLDEWPPVYLLDEQDIPYKNGGKPGAGGQAIRYLPGYDNGNAGQEFAHICFNPQMQEVKEGDFAGLLKAAAPAKTIDGPIVQNKNGGKTRVDVTYFAATLDKRPEFTWAKWEHAANPPVSDGLRDNPCWAKGLAPDDPGFALLTWDPFYGGKNPPYDYHAQVTKTPMPKQAVVKRTAEALMGPRTTLHVATRTVEGTAPARTVEVVSRPEVTDMPPDCDDVCEEHDD